MDKGFRTGGFKVTMSPCLWFFPTFACILKLCQVDEKKDAEIALILRKLESQIPNWDTSKCPAVTLSAYKPTYRYYIVRF